MFNLLLLISVSDYLVPRVVTSQLYIKKESHVGIDQSFRSIEMA